MTRDIFLAAFVGCLLAVAVGNVAMMQILRWLNARAMRKAATMAAAMATGAHVVCDRCGSRNAYEGGAAPAHIIRARFQDLGWRLGDCACPGCVAREQTPTVTG